MRFFEGRHDGRQAITEVAIIDVAKYKEHKESKVQILSGVSPFRAVIDTGATSTMITSRVVKESGLQFHNKKLFRIADGEEAWRPAYLFQVAFFGATLPVGDSEEDGISKVRTIYPCRKEINGGEIRDESLYDVLLGMDVLSTGNLIFRRDYTFRFDFE